MQRLSSNKIVPGILSVLVSIVLTYCQTYSDDSLAVRAILDANGFYNLAVESVTFTKEDRISSLSIRSVEVQVLPPEIGKLTRLEKLDLYSSKVKELPAEIGACTSLVDINLYANELTELPVSIGNLTRLKKLMLDGNKITDIPSTIGNCHSLEMLNLRSNCVAEIPGELADCVTLKELYLSHNTIREIPVEIGRLSNLYSLWLDYNTIQVIPGSIEELSKLFILVLSNNEIDELPEEIGNMPDLGQLFLRANNLTTLPEGITNLTNIYIYKGYYHCCLNGNKIDPKNLTPEVKAWADKYDPDWLGSQDIQTGKTIQNTVLPGSITLHYRSSNKLLYLTLPASSHVKLDLFSGNGRLITSLINGWCAPGEFTVSMPQMDIADGIYFVKLSTGRYNYSKKIVLVK